MELVQHVKRWLGCRACELCDSRYRMCFCRGTVPCDVLFVGEAPGDGEDAVGQPFIGPAGRLLDDVIARWQAFHSNPPSWCMTNLVCCLPKLDGEKGEPLPEHVAACRPRLEEFVRIARPRLLVCVGKQAADYLNQKRRMRHSIDVGPVPHCEIDHPAYILRINVAQRSLLAQRCVVKLKQAWEEVLAPRSTTLWNDPVPAAVPPLVVDDPSRPKAAMTMTSLSEERNMPPLKRGGAKPAAADRLTGVTLGVSLFDLDRLTPATRARVQAMLDCRREAVGMAGEDAVLPFTCPLLVAALLADKLRSDDRAVGDAPTKVYARRGHGEWKRFSASDILVIVDGHPRLDPELFPEARVAQSNGRDERGDVPVWRPRRH